MRVHGVSIFLLIGLSLTGCAAAFPNSHPGHNRNFGCSREVVMPTGDTSGPYIGGSIRSQIHANDC